MQAGIITIGAGAALLLGIGHAAVAAPGDGLAICATCTGTTMTSLEGVGTSNAKAVAEVSIEDLRNACIDQNTGVDVDEQCVAERSPAELGKRYSSAGDCLAGTIDHHDELTYRVDGIWSDDDDGVGYADGEFRFRGPDGSIVSGARAFQGMTLAVNFKTLCPSYTLRSDHESRKPAGRYAWSAAYDHNGSFMLADTTAGVIVYAEPKASLAGVVEPDTVLFRGDLSNLGEIRGTAYTFRAGCEPAPYEVTGGMEELSSDLVLRGEAPVRAKGGCAIVGTSTTSGNATLRFGYIPGDEPS